MNDISKDELVKKIVEETEINNALIKRILLGNLFKFNRFALGIEEQKNAVPLAPFHKEMCSFIDKNPRRFKLVLVPRGHLKSSLVTVGKSLQWMYQDPSVRILIANATYKMAATFVGQIQRHLKFNQKLMEKFGSIADNPVNWTNDTITLEAAKEAHGKKEATLTGFGMGGNLVSQHYDKIILDDIVNRDTINTREQIEKSILFLKDILDLLEPGGELIILGTRWHDEDLYGWIMDKENDMISSFDIFMRPAYTGNLRDHLNFQALWSEKFNRNILEKLYREKGPYEFACTPRETPILMADWTIKQIEDVKVGDLVIGFKNGIGTNKNHLLSSRVLHKMEKEDKVNNLIMESGRIVRCTKDHRWYTGRFDKTHKRYSEGKIGKSLSFVNDWRDKTIDLFKLNYLAGIIDGEGSFKSGGQVTITQSPKKNPGTYFKIKQTLNELNIDFKEYKRSVFKNHSESSVFSLSDSKEILLKLVRFCDFGKKDQAIDWLTRKSSRFVKEEDRIIDIISSDRERVFALETQTGNYIAWGYASSNCQYLNDPVPDEDAVFQRQWFHYYDETELRGRPLNKFTAVDPAISLDTEADYTSIMTIGVDHFHNWYILDIFRDRVTPKQLIDQLYVTYERWHPIEVAIENVAFQKVLQYSLNEEGRKRRKYLPVVEVKPEMRTKDERVRGLQPLYANGTILHNKDLVYNSYLEDELTRFPRGKHDDIIDALSYMKDIVSAPRTATRNYEHSGSTHYLY